MLRPQRRRRDHCPLARRRRRYTRGSREREQDVEERGATARVTAREVRQHAVAGVARVFPGPRG